MLELIVSVSVLCLIFVTAVSAAEDLGPLAKWTSPSYRVPESGDIDSLLVLLSNPDKDIRGKTAGLAWMALRDNIGGAERFVPPLLAMFKNDSNTYVRQQCAVALSESGDPRVPDLLLEVARDTTEDPDLRGAALYSLLTTRSHLAQVVALGVANLNSQSFELRLRSIMAAATTDKREDAQVLVQALIDHFEDPNEIFKTTMVDHKMSQYDFLSREYWASAVPTVMRIDTDLLIPLLNHPNEELRESMALMLSRDKRALPGLVSILTSSENGDWRIRAAMALGDLGDSQAITALTEALQDDYCAEGFADWCVAERAYRSLLKLGVQVEKVEGGNGERPKYRVKKGE